MKEWRVKEQKYNNCHATKDYHYDKITKFKSADKANLYYTSTFNNNYKTVLEQRVNGKWQAIASSCCCKFARS